MQTCPSADELDSLLNDRLDPAAAAGLSDHLTKCAACRTAAERLVADPDSSRWAALRTEPETQPPADVLARLQAAGGRRSGAFAATVIGRVATGADGADAGVRVPPGYEYLGFLGRGGMGVVYKVRHLALKRVVALKMLRPEAVAEPVLRARLIAEAEALARLHHPNVAEVYEVGGLSDTPYLALEYVEGPTLAQVLGGRAHPPRLAAALAATLARAAHHAHGLGIVHRDLKPANVLLAPAAAGRPPALGDCTPKVTDFGLAKRLDEVGQTQTGDILGTPAYMAPEQARGDRSAITPLTDVYALGVILYECLTGRPPHTGPTTVDTVLRVLNTDPARPRSIAPGVPTDLETVCLKCLEKDPRRRYRSAEELAADLDRFLAGEPVLARPLGRPARAWRWARRHPTAATLLAVLLGVAGGGFPAVTALWLDARANEQAAVTAGGVARAAQADADQARTAMARQSAQLLADKAFQLLADENLPRALHWLVEAVRVCPAESDADRDLRRVLLTTVADVAGRLARPVAPIASSNASCAVFAPDGRTVAVGDFRGTVRLFDAATGAEARPPLVHSQPAHDLAFSPDGTKLLVGYALTRAEYEGGNLGAGTCLVWDVRSGARVGTPMLAPGLYRAVGWSPDGERIAIGAANLVTMWEAVSHRPVGQPWKFNDEILAVRFAPDSRALAVGFVGPWADLGERLKWGCDVIDLADGRVTPVMDFRKGRPERLAWGPGGRGLAAGSSSRFVQFRRLDPGTRAPLGPAVVLPGGLIGLAADGGMAMVAADDRNVRLVATADGSAGPVLRTGWPGWVSAADPAGGLFLKEADVWELPRPLSRPRPTRPQPPHPVSGSTVSADGSTLAFHAPDLGLFFIRTSDGRPAFPPVRGSAGRLALSQDGRRAASGFAPAGPVMTDVRFWSPGDEKPAFGGINHGSPLGGVAISPDGRRAATGTFGCLVTVVDLDQKKIAARAFANDIVLALDFSPSGRWLAVGTMEDRARDPDVKLLDLATGKFDGPAMKHGRDGVRQVAFSPDETRLLAVSDTVARLWDVTTRTPVGPTVPVAGPLRGRPFSPDGKWFLCREADDRVGVRAADTGRRIGPPLGGPGPVVVAAFSPDSRLVAVGHADGSAGLWDLATARPFGLPVAQRNRIEAIDWSSDGRSFTTVSGAGVPRRWPVPAAAADDPAALVAAVEVLTAARMDVGPEVSPLDRDEWQERLARFRATYGSLDAVLGAQPAAADWHDARARDAEEEGDPGTALYHLDRRLAAVPADGTAVLRRMHQRRLAGDRPGADADRRRATELVGAAEVRSWARHYEALCRGRKQTDAADWYAGWAKEK